MLALSGSRWHALTAMMRSFMLALMVLCVPLVFRLAALGASFQSGSAWLALLPPAWFVGLQRVLVGSGDPWFVHLTGIALAAVSAAAGIVAVVYMLLFRHFERFMLRSIAISPYWSETRRATAFPDETPEDHNTGVSLLRGLYAYLHGQSRVSRRFFRDVIRDARVVWLLDESVAVVRRWHEQHRTGEREAFDRTRVMRSPEFAKAEAGKLRDLLAAPRVGAGVSIH